MKKTATFSVLAMLLAACSNTPIQPPGDGHLRAEKVDAGGTAPIPAPIQQLVALPPPKASAKVETYSVVVNNVKVQELLFALARDAKLNVDIHPGIEGVVTLNAIDQTLQQLLTRIAKQVDLRWELNGPNLAVMPDTPYLRTYTVDYVNIARDSTSSVAINTQIASTSAGVTAGGGGASGGNNSATTVSSKSQNHFWESIEKNIKDLLRETDKVLPEGSSETVTERLDQQQTTGTGAPPPTGRSQNAGNASGTLANSPNPASLQQQGTTIVRKTTFREAASVITNPEAGVIVVRATSRQHEKVQEFLDQVASSSRRQVMIEATIAEVLLKNDYEQGINWQSLRSLRKPGTAGFSVGMNPTGLQTNSNSTVTLDQVQAIPGGTLTTSTVTTASSGIVPDPFAEAGKTFLLNYIAPGLGIASTIKLLETFGNVKVLSSPKISVLNNQTAMLKVVNNIVYFTVKSDTTTTASGPGQTTVTTTPNSVSVGLVMSVTPQISENGNILLNVRPTISRVTAYKTDPNPSIPATLVNAVPEIQTREMESMLRLTNGEIAVMGGLMQETLDNSTDAVPLLSKLPGVGNFFTNRADKSEKTELVIFLKPTIIRDPSVQGDYRNFSRQLPSEQFFRNNPGPQQQQIRLDQEAAGQ